MRNIEQSKITPITNIREVTPHFSTDAATATMTLNRLRLCMQALRDANPKQRLLIAIFILSIVGTGCNSEADPAQATIAPNVCIFEVGISPSNALEEGGIPLAKYEEKSLQEKAHFLRQGGFVQEWKHQEPLDTARRIADEAKIIASASFSELMGIESVPPIIIHDTNQGYYKAVDLDPTEITNDTATLGTLIRTDETRTIHINLANLVFVSEIMWSAEKPNFNNSVQAALGMESPDAHNLTPDNTLVHIIMSTILHEIAHYHANTATSMTSEEALLLVSAVSNPDMDLSNFRFTNENMGGLIEELTDDEGHWIYLPHRNLYEWDELQRAFIQQNFYNRQNDSLGWPREYQIHDLHNGVAMWSYLNKRLEIPDDEVVEWLMDFGNRQDEIGNLAQFIEQYRKRANQNGYPVSFEQVYDALWAVVDTSSRSRDYQARYFNMPLESRIPYGEYVDEQCDYYDDLIATINQLLNTPPL